MNFNLWFVMCTTLALCLHSFEPAVSEELGELATSRFVQSSFERSGVESGEFESREFESRETEPPEIERIETDRHDFTQSTETVPQGMFQVEMGYSFFGSDDETAHTLPETMLRIGITPIIEARLRYNYAWQFAEDDRRGAEDLRPSVKLRLNDQHRWLPESALEIRMSVPTGDDVWSTSEVEAGADYIYAWAIGDSMKLYGSTGWMSHAIGDFSLRPDSVDDNFSLVTQSLAFGAELNDSVTYYLEFFGGFTHGFEDDEENPVFFNIGADYFLNDHFVLDARVGWGLNDDADDFFAGIGCGIRF